VASGADELLPVLILAVLRCSNLLNLIANVEYIRDYTSPERLRSEAGYYVTHVESAVAFLERLSAAQLTGVATAELEAALAATPAVVMDEHGRGDLTSGASDLSSGASAFAGSRSPRGLKAAIETDLGNAATELGGSGGPPFPPCGDLGAAPEDEAEAVCAVIKSATGALATTALEPRAATSDHDGVSLDADLCGGRLPSRVLVLSPEEIIGALEPPPPSTLQRGDASEALEAWLGLRLRFTPLRSANELRLADLQPLLDEYRALAQTAQNLRYLLAERDLLPSITPLLEGRGVCGDTREAPMDSCCPL
jgi:hypothetical protein